MAEAVPVAELLQRVAGQWLLAGDGLPFGLRAEAVESVMNMIDIPPRHRLEIYDQVMDLGDVMITVIRDKQQQD